MFRRQYIIMICFLLLFVRINKVYGKELNEINDWETRIELSYMNNSGAIGTQTLLGKINIKKENEKTRYFLKGNTQYGETYNSTNKSHEIILNKWLIDTRYERMFTNKLFGFSSINYFDNDFSGYDYNILIGSGCGYDIIKTKKHYLKGLLSTLYSYDCFMELENNNKIDKYGSEKIAIDYTFNISEDFTFKEIVDYLHSFKNNEKYFINSETALEVKINTFLSLGFGYIINYQNNPPSSQKDINCTEKTFTTSIIINL